MSDNIASWPSKYTKKQVREEFGANGNDQHSIWNYGDYIIWFLHLARQRPTGGWESTSPNGRINIWYMDKNDALIIEMRNGKPHHEDYDKLVLAFASNDEETEYEFKGVYKCTSTNDGVIDHVFKRVSKYFDIDEMKPV